MESNRFDQLTKSLSARRSRRQALAGGVAGLSALAVSGRSLGALAQEATPESATEHNPVFLFVQLADRGTWTPKPGEDGVYLLTLSELGEQTLYFSDRPDRIVGTVPTDQFLDSLGFTPENPPNAAVVVTTPAGERDVLVVELFDPVYTRTFGDEGEETLTYEASVLQSYQGTALDEWAPQADDDQLPGEFSNISLFIDDCPDAVHCYVSRYTGETKHNIPIKEYVVVGEIPGAPHGLCYNWGQATCLPCFMEHYELVNLCNAAYPGECEGPRSVRGTCEA